MATYKVLQDIEAEDKLLGPLTLKQFGFAGIVAVCGYITFLLASKGVWFMSVPFWPVMLLFGFLAFPWGRDQPSEIWLLAKLRFYLKPRLRKWDQEGVEELVTITVPKKVEEQVTKDFDREEAKSRLKALAETIDSRGWAIKNVGPGTYSQTVIPSLQQQDSERLMSVSSLANAEPIGDITAFDDILDDSSKTANQLNQLLNASEQAHRNQILEQMHSTTAITTVQTGATAQTSTADERALLEKLHKAQSAPKAMDHLRTLQPTQSVSSQSVTGTKQSSDSKKTNDNTGSTAVNPAILALADNDDLNVATIAREAHKATGTDDPNEVVVSLR